MGRSNSDSTIRRLGLRLLAGGVRRRVVLAFALLTTGTLGVGFLCGRLFSPAGEGFSLGFVMPVLAALTLAGVLLFDRYSGRLLGRLEQDIRQRTRELARAEAAQRLLIEATPDIIVRLDGEGHLEFASHAWLRCFGEQPPLDAPLESVIHEEDREFLRAALAALGREPAGETRVVEVRTAIPGAPERRLELHLHRRAVESEEATGPEIVGVLRDVTSQRRAQEQISAYRQHLVHSREVEGFAKIAGGIAHDFNNLLGAILGFATHAQDLARERDPVRHSLDMITESAQRGANLSRRLLSMSRVERSGDQDVDLRLCLTAVERLMRHHLGDEIDLRVDWPSRLPRLKGDGTQIEQAILNLCLNARDAMPDGGRITVAVKMVTENEGEAVRISVSDTGAGVPEDIQDRIFEPFFTTRSHGQGLGLGLSIVWNVAKDQGGAAWFVSRAGRGATFHLLFPISVPAEAAAPVAVPAAEPEERGPATILVAEDEPAVRELLVTVLESQGHRVLQAEDGWKALDLLDQHQSEIDLLILDIVMPEVSGDQVFAQVQDAARPPRVLVSTGYSVDGQVEEMLDQGADDFLAKPYSVGELVEKVDELLQRPPRLASRAPGSALPA